ncbi:MAG: hypothetical protein D6820_11895, partial [Lentisphaerae bacterium]
MRMMSCSLAGRWLLWLLFLTGTFWADDLYEDLLNRQTGRKFSAVVLRETRHGYLLATPDGIKEMSAEEVQRIQGFAPIPRELNAALSSFERWLFMKRYDQALGEQNNLNRFVARYRQWVEPRLQASSVSDAYKKAVREALKYYQDVVANLEPTIRICRYRDEIKGIMEADKFDGGVDGLFRLARIKKELGGLRSLFRLVERDRKQAIEDYRRVITRELRRQLASARTETLEQWGSSRATAALQLCLKLEKLETEYRALRGGFIGSLLKAGEEELKKFQEVTENSLSFEDGQI